VTAVQSCGVASEIVSNVPEPEGQIDGAGFNGGNAMIRSSPGEKAPGFLISSSFRALTLCLGITGAAQSSKKMAQMSVAP